MMNDVGGSDREEARTRWQALRSFSDRLPVLKASAAHAGWHLDQQKKKRTAAIQLLNRAVNAANRAVAAAHEELRIARASAAERSALAKRWGFTAADDVGAAFEGTR